MPILVKILQIVPVNSENIGYRMNNLLLYKKNINLEVGVLLLQIEKKRM